MWSFAHLLRDDGLSHMAYTEQITSVLCTRMSLWRSPDLNSWRGHASILPTRPDDRRRFRPQDSLTLSVSLCLPLDLKASELVFAVGIGPDLDPISRTIPARGQQGPHQEADGHTTVPDQTATDSVPNPYSPISGRPHTVFT